MLWTILYFLHLTSKCDLDFLGMNMSLAYKVPFNNGDYFCQDILNSNKDW